MIEYAVVLAAVAIGLVAVSHYLRTRVEGGWRDNTEAVSDSFFEYKRSTGSHTFTKGEINTTTTLEELPEDSGR